MAPEPGGSPAPDRQAGEPAAPGAPAAAGGHGEERFGPLAVRRIAKDDGRALLVFEHVGGDGREPQERREPGGQP
jgi:hypothetical protein